MGVLRRVRHRWVHRDEQGFGLLELVIASTVMMTALTSMAYVTTNAFSDIAMAKERHAANALLDEAIERLRALPYDTVSLGMRTSDLAGDPRILGAGTSASPYRLATSNDRIVHVSVNVTVEPLVPNVTSRTVNGIVFAVRVYLTHFQDNPTSGAVTATAYVDWHSNVRGGGATFMRTSTVIFSPAAAAAGSSNAACLSTATHPFSGPCLAFFHGSAEVEPARSRISSTTSTTDSALVDGPGASSLLQVEQTSAVQGSGVGNGVTLDPDGTPQSWGYPTDGTQATNDPASTGPPKTYDRKEGSAAAPASALVSLFGDATMSVSVGAASSFESVSTTRATTTDPTKVCADLAGATQTDELPCGRSLGTQAGATTATVGLDWLGLGLGTMDVVRQGATTVGAHTNRDTTSSGLGVCTDTTSTGCVRSRATRTINSFRIGGVPNALKPLGFSYLVELTGYSDSATAEAGIKAGPPDVTSAGTVSYWNGLGYTSVAFSTIAGTTLTVPVLNTFNGSVALTITANLRGGSRFSSGPETTCMSTLACRTRAEAVMTSPLSGTLDYELRVGGTTRLAFSTSIDLGPLSASASYADPPVPA